MRRSLPLTLVACLVLAGCGALRPSATWSVVRATRVDTRDEADPSAVYAERLSAVLKSAHVEHKVVTYEYRYRTRIGEEAVNTRTAVLYRDGASARNPWWLMDERLRVPKWLPGGDLDRQLTFYMRRPATVVSVDGHAPGVDGKARVAQPGVEKPSFFARLWPVRKTERSRRFAPHPAKQREAITPRMLALFRMRHGSTFDPSSVLDRVKMERLARDHRLVASR